MHARRLTVTTLATAAATGAALTLLPGGAAAQDPPPTEWHSSNDIDQSQSFEQEVPVYASLATEPVPVLRHCNNGSCAPVYTVPAQDLGNLRKTSYGLGLTVQKAAGSGVALTQPLCDGLAGVGFDITGTSTPTTGTVYVFRVVDGVTSRLFERDFKTDPRRGTTGYHFCVE